MKVVRCARSTTATSLKCFPQRYDWCGDAYRGQTVDVKQAGTSSAALCTRGQRAPPQCSAPSVLHHHQAANSAQVERGTQDCLRRGGDRRRLAARESLMPRGAHERDQIAPCRLTDCI